MLPNSIASPVFALISGMMLICRPANAQSGLPSSASSSVPVNVSGVVVNANGGAPIGHALVQLNDRAVLTDHEGRFEFDQYGPASVATIQVKKPGFYFGHGIGINSTTLRGSQLTSPIVLRLYPEALVTGTLTGPDGPLRQVMVMAMQSSYSDSGHQWFPVGQTMSNSRGEFRLAVPPGDYRIEVNFTPRLAGSTAVLPLIYPAAGPSGDENGIHLASETEQRVDLHPVVDRTYAVSLHLDTQGRGFPMLSARANDGSILPVSVLRNGPPGGDEIRVALPSGTYTLIANRNMGDASEYGEATVTVADHDLAGIVLHMSPVASIPVQISVDVDATSDKTPPTVQQLGLMLLNTQSGGGSRIGVNSQIAMPMTGGQGSYLHPMPGVYRLGARSSSQWYIKSASFGSIDLLREPMTVAPAAGGSPIVVTVSNDTGGLQGSVHKGGVSVTAWVSAVPTFPSTVPVYTANSGVDGSFNLASLPPGSYQVLAFESRPQRNFRDSKSLAAFTTYMKSVTVTHGNNANVDLEVVPDDEVNP